MTIFRHNKTGKLYTIRDNRGGHKFLGSWITATPYKHDGDVLGKMNHRGLVKKAVTLEDFMPFANVPYRVPVTL